MTYFFSLAIGATVFCGIALASFFFFTRTSRATLQRIYEVTYAGRRLKRNVPLTRDAGRRLFTMVRWVRAKLGMGVEIGLPQRLANAGYKGTLPADIYNSARILSPLMGLLAGSAIPFDRMFWMIALPAAGFIAPNIVLTRLVARRREKIRRSIPDAIDLLVICVDAGSTRHCCA
jgi:tight adherence protein C